MAENYYNFDEAAQKLGLSEDELLNLVSNNALRAYRVGRTTKFKVEDIDNYDPGNKSVPGMESQVIELDDLPDDIELVDVEPKMEVSDDSFTETAAVSSPALETEESAISDLNIPEEEISVESASEIDITENDAVAAVPEIDIIDDDSAEVSAASDIDIIDEQEEKQEMGGNHDDSNELIMEDIADDSAMNGETVLTDSSSMGITEEINADEVDVNTQEITLQEEAISPDEIGDGAAEETIPVDDIGETVPVDVDEDFTEDSAPAAPARRSGMSARSSSLSARRRSPLSEPAAPSDGSLKWTIMLAALVVLMIYPTFLVLSIVIFDIADTRTSLEIGEQKTPTTLGKKPPLRNVGAPVLPKMFRWIDTDPVVGVNKHFRDWWGHRKTEVGGKQGLDKFIPYEERVAAGLVKNTVSAAAGQEEAAAEDADAKSDDEAKDEDNSEKTEEETAE